MKYLIDLDEEALDAARHRLRTVSLGDTVNAALRLVAERAADDREVNEALDVLARFEFDDRDRGVALSHLADTSVLARLHRPAVLHALQGPVARRHAGICRISRLELGFSARNGAEWDEILGATSVLTLVELEPEDLRRAERVQRQLADAGLKCRKVPDLLVAAAAERLGLVVLHYDRDFERIAGVTGRPHEWVVPPGEID